MDVWVGNLVTVVEEVDFRGVAARLGEFDAGIFAMGNRERAARTKGPHLIAARRRAGESGAWRVTKKVENRSNFLYPAGLFIASKEVDVHVLEYAARRAQLPDGSE
jgi:hypothetical protein